MKEGKMNKIYSKVYGWLFVGLLLTFATGAFFSNYENSFFLLILISNF